MIIREGGLVCFIFPFFFCIFLKTLYKDIYVILEVKCSLGGFSVNIYKLGNKVLNCDNLGGFKCILP